MSGNSSDSPASDTFLIFVLRVTSSSWTCAGGSGFIPAPNNSNPNPSIAARREDFRFQRMAITAVHTNAAKNAKITVSATSASMLQLPIDQTKGWHWCGQDLFKGATPIYPTSLAICDVMRFAGAVALHKRGILTNTEAETTIARRSI